MIWQFRKKGEHYYMNEFLDISPEVKAALSAGRPVVALESTIISHGMPYPKNVETAMLVEKTIRDNGAVPATVAIIGGRLKAGLSPEEIEYLGKTGRGVAKVSRRDLPVIVARGADGATTVTTTMIIAHMAGIQVFATGGIGGVHRGAETTMDISADLEELSQTPVMVICAGAKAILDLGLTLEYLETKGVPVIGYGTDELPAFYTRKSGFGVDYRLDTPAQLAAAFRAQRGMGMKTGMLVTNPIPEEYSMDHEVINKAIDQAIEESRAQGIKGKETTPFLLARVAEITGGDSLESNIKLVLNNAALAAKTAAELCRKIG
jgi:pseudouridylate synthase